jgi:hypothetical protein
MPSRCSAQEEGRSGRHIRSDPRPAAVLPEFGFSVAPSHRCKIRLQAAQVAVGHRRLGPPRGILMVSRWFAPFLYFLLLLAVGPAGAQMSTGSRTKCTLRVDVILAAGGHAPPGSGSRGRWAASSPRRSPVDGGMAYGSLLLLDAPSLRSGASDVRYGGQEFDSEGLIPAPITKAIRPDADGDYVFALPNAAVALLTAEPAKPIK